MSNSDFNTLPHKDKVGEIPEFLPPMSRSGNRIINNLPNSLKKVKEKVVKSEGGNVKMLSAFEGAYVRNCFIQNQSTKHIYIIFQISYSFAHHLYSHRLIQVITRFYEKGI